MKTSFGMSGVAIAIILGNVNLAEAKEQQEVYRSGARGRTAIQHPQPLAELTLSTPLDLEEVDSTAAADPHQNASELLLSDRAPGHDTDASAWTSSRPDGHAPIGVMGDHTHHAGEVMFSYRYMYMNMDGNRSGTDSLSDAEVLQQFPVTPQNMTMQMHMFGAMYAPTDNLTLMGMTSYIVKEMDHLTRRGVRFTTRSQGFGDSKLVALYRIFNQNRQRIHLNLGLGLPTGSIGERDDTPAGEDVILPYPMQIGSGTFDFLAGLTYLGQGDRWSWGAQALTTLPISENANNYRLGNQYNATAWGAYRWTDWLSSSIRLNGKTWGDISGADARLNPMMIPTADPDRRGGSRIDLGLGLNLYAPEGSLQGTRLGIEFAFPVYQSLTGPQLETDWQLTVGVQASF
ncbi:MAG: transporter [Cyanobacteriota bacterium]|nr:transporter [Cyanobacteriota bacterium]